MWAQVFGNPLTWDDLPWLRSLTKLPLIVKGILHPGDARCAIDRGVDGIYCSNHGGRQANGGLPALDCLAEVVAAAGDTPVLFDSGVRSADPLHPVGHAECRDPGGPDHCQPRAAGGPAPAAAPAPRGLDRAAGSSLAGERRPARGRRLDRGPHRS